MATDRSWLSSRREAKLVALWATLFGVFIVGYLWIGIGMWSGVYGPLILGGLVLLVLLFNVARARSRTVRPRHYNLLEGIAALWGAVGVGITAQVLGVPDGAEVSAGLAVVAALVFTAPLFGCATWLAVRGR